MQLVVAACPSQNAGLYTGVTGAGPVSIAVLHDISEAAHRTGVAPRWVLETNSSRPSAVRAPFGIIDAGGHSVYGEDVHTGSIECFRHWEELECDFQGRQVPGSMRPCIIGSTAFLRTRFQRDRHEPGASGDWSVWTRG